MKRIDIMKRAARNLSQSKARTALTSLAIAVGAFTLTLSLAGGEGARQYAEKIIQSNINPRAMFIVRDPSFFEATKTPALQEYSTNLTQVRGSTVKELAKSDIDYFKSSGDFDSLEPVYNLSMRYLTVQGYDKKYVGTINSYDTTVLGASAAGVLPQLGVDLADNQAVIPEEYVKILGGNAADYIGKTVTVTFSQTQANPTEDQISQAFSSGGQAAVSDLLSPKTQDFTFTIVAVTKKASTASQGSTVMKVSSNMASNMNDYVTAGTPQAGKYIGVQAITKQGKDADTVKKSLTDKGYGAKTAKDLQGLIFTFVNTLQGIVLGFGLLALIASVFGIVNTQYISVLERTSQIGLMKALGMSRKGVAKLFRYEAAWIGLIGASIGAALGILTGWLLNPVISKALDLGDDKLLIFVWWQVAAMIGSLVLIAIVAGWFPARKAARLDPIEALRTE